MQVSLLWSEVIIYRMVSLFVRGSKPENFIFRETIHHLRLRVSWLTLANASNSIIFQLRFYSVIILDLYSKLYFYLQLLKLFVVVVAVTKGSIQWILQC